MQTSAETLYLDSSALVKLVIEERGSSALRGFLASGGRRTSCALARVEVMRTARPYGEESTARVRRVLAFVDMIQLDDPLLDLAAEIGPPLLRSLDAIHLAAAWRLRPNIEIITYDHRLRKAATALGLAVASPGA